MSAQNGERASVALTLILQSADTASVRWGAPKWDAYGKGRTQ